MSANAGLLLGCAFWFLAYAGNWVAAGELGHQQAKVVKPPIEPMIPAAPQSSNPTASQDSPGRGLSLFLSNGCGACHTIRGTEARGTIGPDLSHVGSRTAIGAGVLPNTEEAFARFVARPDLFKPGVKMPAFDVLPQTEIQTIARYLKALQ
ncbi:c-type cytochrome [Mesorhizobium sp. CA8]|uniref:c-type cytochrome n=1 Tax=unclassified Mesorhizobium TaxID=325217 RepID=UPI001CCD9609|nr:MULTISPECIES: c-type cytochrome [unclassified Mesorhizobium]MBZ9761199.1 c-type cytochrome [Mesorhizobium sp. CA8]MBZ9819385.1 c-type cytochrome [Mesorhizobium sp. CA4]